MQVVPLKMFSLGFKANSRKSVVNLLEAKHPVKHLVANACLDICSVDIDVGGKKKHNHGRASSAFLDIVTWFLQGLKKS